MSTTFSIKFTNNPLPEQMAKLFLIEQTLLASGMWLSSYIKGHGSIEVAVTFDPDIPTWNGGSATNRDTGVVISKDGKQYRLLQDSVIAEIQTGTDINGSAPDGVMSIGTTNLEKWYWFDPTLWTANDIPGARTDAFRIGLHELLHAMGFNGWLAGAPAAQNSSVASIYDQYLVVEAGREYFTGPNAIQAFGGWVPVTGSHLGDQTSFSQAILKGTASVMSYDYAPNGVRTPIDSVVTAVLKDLGYDVRDSQARLQGTPNSIDIVNFEGNAHDYRIIQTLDLQWLSATNKSDYSWLLDSVERLHFTDSHLAIDLEGNAGTVAKILGAVFGKNSLANEKYVGIGLDLLDNGMSYINLAGLALAAANATTNEQIVNLLWTNVIGAAPADSEKAPFIQMLEGGMTPGALAQLAAETSFNIANINLVGLAETGLEYMLV